MTALPPFPVDPGTLDAIEEAVHATYDSTTNTLDELLELLSRWTPEGDETIHDGAVHVDVGPLYSREDVILALITEVRELRDGGVGWYRAGPVRAVAPDGAVWAEARDEADVRARARRGDRLEVLWCHELHYEWRPA
ncbi:hypothetical protein [Tsukamurella pseudospumae]|uniref:SnoaL-like domain-containing protein n=1 Tax=Tsukamurella pseudospumae TaxID=239498 RepID=A0A137ZRQ3_9ACTN|nr:hypothetical protein [Tsukamurella pseudospumae]KXP00883.1 hypothetical protein AXK61_12810 [Tsukamurella pseudospumae]